METDKRNSLCIWLPIIGFLSILIFFIVSPDPFVGYAAWFIYLVTWTVALIIQYRVKRYNSKVKRYFVIQTISLFFLFIWLVVIVFGDKNWSVVKAATYKHPKIVRLLLACGASASAKDKNGNTVLGRAASNNDLETLQLLLFLHDKKRD